MKIHTQNQRSSSGAKLSICIASLVALACPSHAVTIIADSFADGDIATNPGDGMGFNTLLSGGGAVTESTGATSLVGGTAGSSRAQIGSIDTFAANGTLATTGVFTVTDFGRTASANSNTSRSFVGFSQVANGVVGSGVTETAVDGLWVALQSREDAGGADNGEGALFYIDGATVTNLGTWTWDQSLVEWDAASTLRSDRIAVDLLAPLTLTLTSDVTGYSLSFATSGSGTLPADLSGTWAAAGVTNDLSSVHASAHLQGDGSSNLALSEINVSIADAIPEPSSTVLVALSLLSITVVRKRSV